MSLAVDRRELLEPQACEAEALAAPGRSAATCCDQSTHARTIHHLRRRRGHAASRRMSTLLADRLKTLGIGVMRHTRARRLARRRSDPARAAVGRGQAARGRKPRRSCSRLPATITCATPSSPRWRAALWVICDRFIEFDQRLSGRRSAMSIRRFIRALERVTVGDLKPDLTFMLDVPAEVGLARAQQAARRARGGPVRGGIAAPSTRSCVKPIAGSSADEPAALCR